MLESDNEARTRVIWGSEARSYALVSRRVFSRSKGRGLKLAEFTVRVIGDILRSRPDVVWAHNQEGVPIVAIALLLRRWGRVGRVVWDQHELPDTRVFQNRLLARIWSGLMEACDVVALANRERRVFLEERLTGRRKVCYSVLENRADRAFRALPSRPLPENVRAWLGGRLYLLLQGGAHPHRHFENVVLAVIERPKPDVCLVVVGGRREALESSLRRRWGELFDHRVFFTGWIPQMEITPLIDHAVGSIVLYQADRPNTFYCAPNRLYQTLARGIPVIVGANPPMAGLVADHGVGIVLDGTGDSPDDIARGIRALFTDPAPYREAAERCRDLLLWEEQEPEIMRIRDGAFDPVRSSIPAASVTRRVP